MRPVSHVAPSAWSLQAGVEERGWGGGEREAGVEERGWAGLVGTQLPRGALLPSVVKPVGWQRVL